MTNSMEPSLYNVYEKGDTMYYEVYVDSLFLVNSVMNFYLLLLVNHSTFRTATCKRLVLGAMVGAGFGLVPLVDNLFLGVRLFIGIVIGTIAMILIAFPVKSIKALGSILEKLIIYSFLMGGVLLFFIRQFSFIRRYITGIFGLMGIGALACFLFLLRKEGMDRKKQECICHATLTTKEGKIKVLALLDSGNSLIEPISGKPVCIIEQEVFRSLWKKENLLYRVIPYHSIGKDRGILQGYLLQKLQLDLGGVEKTFSNVYVAVCQEKISEDVKMIVNPMILKNY